MSDDKNKNIAWWKGAVIYQIYPRSFLDTNGDGIGDLPGIIEKMDYIADLGVDGIWISPFFTSPMNDFGYDVADYCNVDPVFGTLQDFDRLLDKAHGLGLKVIIDQVYSHTSDQHPWFVQSRMNKTNDKHDWYVWQDARSDGSKPNNWLAEFGGSAWTFDIRRGQYYKHNFQRSMPDLNLYNPDVRAAICDVMRFWLDRGVDGFRLDVANMYLYDRQFRDNPPKTQGYTRFGSELGKQGFFYPYDMQYHVYNKCRPENIDVIKLLRSVCDEYDDKMLVGEMFSDDSVVRAAEYTKDESLLHTAYNFQLSEPEYSAAKIRSVVEHFILSSPTSWPSWAFTNHDWSRVSSRWAVDGQVNPQQSKLLYALLCSLQGTIFVYQGEELGLDNAKLDEKDIRDPLGRILYPEYVGRDGSRTPMPWDDTQPNAGFSTGAPWLPIYGPHIEKAINTQDRNDKSVLNFVRHFLKWRKTMPDMMTGDIKFHSSHEPALIFTRGQNLICFFNLGPNEILLPIPYGEWQPCDIKGFEHTRDDASLKLPGFNAAIFQKA